MAAFTRRIVKVTVLTAGAVPLIGFAGSVSAATKDGEEGRRSPVRACDLPMYEVSRPKKKEEEENVEFYEPSSFEKQISSVRKAISYYSENFLGSYESLKNQAETAVAHSKMTLNYVQTNPGELPRVCFISVATMGGFVLGYRGGILRKVMYAGIAAAASTALCYPNYTIELTDQLVAESKQLWKENIGWPLEDSPSDNKETSSEKPNTPKKVKGDQGQSNAEDKDMYSSEENSSEGFPEPDRSKVLPVPGYRFHSKKD